MWSELADFITRVGFPIAVAAYLLLRLEPTIGNLGKTITALTIVVATLSGDDYRRAFRLAGAKIPDERMCD